MQFFFLLLGLEVKSRYQNSDEEPKAVNLNLFNLLRLRGRCSPLQPCCYFSPGTLVKSWCLQLQQRNMKNPNADGWISNSEHLDA